jgi:choline dehydrogenase-like flavoprotein
MTTDFDVIIVGSGPAGVSAAFPLVEAGLRVLMVDGGKQAVQSPPSENFLTWRHGDPLQHKWMVGKNFHALKMQEAVSPKLRVPSLAYVFNEFAQRNQISGDDFITVGSLATGGLSNAWGCGVACFSDEELASFPFPASEIRAAYANVARRIGISGGVADDMSGYFGLDAWSQPPIAIDKLHTYLLQRYNNIKETLNSEFKMGHARVAALSLDHGIRQACTLSGNCLWGCDRRALYSATDELPALQKYENFYLQTDFLVTKLHRINGAWTIQGETTSGQEHRSISATKILLAAGTLATTRLVLQTLGYHQTRPLMTCPTAAFMVWVPRFLGKSAQSGFGLGQLSFALTLNKQTTAFGSTFATTGLPVSEFVRHVPFKVRYGIDLLKGLLSSCVVGNVFLPGIYGNANVKLSMDGRLVVSHSPHAETADLMKAAARIVSKTYRKIGAVVLPGSFTIGRAGSDIHYAGTLPMRKNPVAGETGPFGEVATLEDLYVIDGANLCVLPEKSHTLTIMANADRIARRVCDAIRSN